MKSIKFIAIFCAVISVISCSRGSKDSNAPVVIEPVKVRESSPVINILGTMVARDRVDVKLPKPAKIQEVYVNKGDAVIEGTPLAKISEEDINLRLNTLRASKKEAETTIEKNQYLFKNRDKLMEEGKLDKVQFDGLAIELANSEATLERIKAETTDAEYNLAHIQIVSPIKGMIMEKYAAPQQLGGENQVLFVVIGIDPILASFPINAQDSAGVKIGNPVKIRIEELENKEFSGTVSYVGPEVSQDGRTFEVLATIPNPEYILKSGMFASIELPSTTIHKVIVVPSSAIITRNREKFVFKVDNGIAKRTKVAVRNTNNDVAEISSGLEENDFVAVQGAGNLQDGGSVEMRR